MNNEADFDQPIAWQPDAEKASESRLAEFMRQTGSSEFADAYQKSIIDVAEFTNQVLNFFGIRFDPPFQNIMDTSDGIQFPKWCQGGGLNISEMCLDRWQTDAVKNQHALICEDENGTVKSYSYAELLIKVEDCTIRLRGGGCQKGDAIGIHLPMIAETVITLLAVARIGAIAVPVFSGYGAEAIASRLNAVKAKVLITCDGFQRRGKHFDALRVAEQAALHCPTIETVFVIANSSESAVTMNEKFKSFDSIESNDLSGAAESTAAEDALMILYTSGTTGKPKGILHTHVGFPIKAAQDMAFGMNVGRGTRISWLTDLGWMMGPWLIFGALINGGTIVLYDGAPDYPTPERMWGFCAKHQVEVLGISPTLIRTLMTCGDDLPDKHDLSSLKAFASTGEPWNPAPWWWLFEKVGKSRLPIINYSGGTEISGGILSGNPLLPIKPCSFPAPCLGIDAAILDENGAEAAGKVGELVIRKPWIGMARGFWEDDARYLETYWSKFENVWVHGDFALKDADGHWFILGRSDDTLKVAGKRVGPAEVESVLVNHPLVTEAAVIGVPDDIKGTAIIAFCVPRGAAGENLENELKNLTAAAMGKPLKPSRIFFVPALPKTRNGKVMRRVIRAAYLGEDAGDLSALENPDAVSEISNVR